MERDCAVMIRLEKIAIIADDETYTYMDLNKLQREFAAYLDSRTLIFIVCENTIESLIGYIGSINNKTVPLMLSKSLQYEKYASLIEAYRPEYIWCNNSVDVNSFECVSKKIETLYEYKRYTLYRITYEIEHSEKLYDELALMLSTSGSTGSPKYVRISYENLLSNTKAIVDYLNISDGDVTITTLPMNYTYGLSIINTYLYAGATIILTEDSMIKSSFWDKLVRYGVTSISGVPYTYDILKKLKLDKRCLPSLRLLTQAGGKLSDDTRKYLMEYCEREQKKLIVMYGQTEATARISYMPYEQLKIKEKSIGIPVPEGRMWIADECGRRITSSYTEGEIVYEGKNVTLGYALNRSDLSKGDERKNILHTGDYGYFDDEDFFYINDRKDRQVKLYGNRIDLKVIEKEIVKKYGDECACEIEGYKVYIYQVARDRESEVCGFVSRLLGIPQKNIECFCVSDKEKIAEMKSMK